VQRVGLPCVGASVMPLVLVSFRGFRGQVRMKKPETPVLFAIRALPKFFFENRVDALPAFELETALHVDRSSEDAQEHI
jgi:hypothetical protein